MKVKEYLQKKGYGIDSNKSLTFVIGEVINGTMYYRSTPLDTVQHWIQSNGGRKNSLLDYNVLNDKQPFVSWKSGVDWNPSIQRGEYLSLLIISDEEIKKEYPSETQVKNMLDYIEKKLFND